jgi:hypothetical protein
MTDSIRYQQILTNRLNGQDVFGPASDHRHGGPWDRGAADSYYQRKFRPHYFEGATYSSKEISADQMTERQIDEYRKAYRLNEEVGSFKDWG